MAVTYERVVGRRIRVVRSQPSKRLDASKRWRRVDEQPAPNQHQMTEGSPPSMDEVPTKPAGSDEDGPEVKTDEPVWAGKSRSGTSPKSSSAGQSGTSTKRRGG